MPDERPEEADVDWATRALTGADELEVHRARTELVRPHRRRAQAERDRH